MDAVIFDFDGTILDTEWPAYVSAADEYGSHGIELTVETWIQRSGRADNRPWHEDLLAAVPGLDDAAIDRLETTGVTSRQPRRP